MLYRLERLLGCPIAPSAEESSVGSRMFTSTTGLSAIWWPTPATGRPEDMS